MANITIYGQSRCTLSSPFSLSPPRKYQTDTSHRFVTPATDKDQKVRDKDIINDITDTKATITLAQALGKSDAVAEEDKSGVNSKTRSKGSRPNKTEPEQEDEKPFTAKMPAEAAVAKDLQDKQGDEVSTALDVDVYTSSPQHS